MSAGRVIISDIHGCYYTLLRLLDRCPADHVITLAGDLIDRDPHSQQVVEFAMANKIPTVVGNHEDLMLDNYARPAVGYQDGCWPMNGGVITLTSFGGYIPERVLDWMEALPLEITDGALHISHTGVGVCQDRATSLWARMTEFKDDGRFHVFGHTPSKFAILGSNFARIDTGAAYSKDGFGNLTALVWPEMRVITQAYDESPYTPVRSDFVTAEPMRRAA